MAVYFYTYQEKENISVTEFISSYKRFFANPIAVPEFLSFDDETDAAITNGDRIYDVYDAIEKQTYAPNYDNNTLPYIKPGTDLVLKTDQITIEYLTLYGDNQFLQQGSFNTYWSDSYNNLINNDKYVQVDKLTRTGLRTDVQIINENVRVFIYISALKRIFNISPFIRRLNTSKNFETGAFSITIDPVLRSQSGEILDNFLDTGLDAINVFPLSQEEGDTDDFFTTNLQQNDLVFLRFETLELESANPFVPRNDLSVSATELPGKVWDMIGLVDTINTSQVAENTERIIQINGRDLMKLLIDDASYFIPTVFRNGSDLSFVYAGDENEDYYKRNLISGSYQYYFSYAAKSIRDVLGFVINHLSNLQIVDDQLLDVYGDRVSTQYNVTGADQAYIQTLNVKGIWKIIKLFVDPVLDERRIADDAFANPDGSLASYINRICQKPFVEFYGDTNGDQYDFIVRQQPFTKAAIRGIVGSGAVNNEEAPVNGGYINILEKDVISYSLDWETRYYSWFQIQAQNVFMGNSDSSSLSIIPIIFLPEYVNKFGNKRLIIADNYFSSRSLKGNEDEKSINISLFSEFILNDLKYIIDINSYLPFTRRGTITIIGDRRIKIGTFIRLVQTDELFYVVNVNNSATFIKGSIDRITTLTVERGMKMKYINGVVEPEGFPKQKEADSVGNNVTLRTITYSYFNIVDTTLIVKNIINRLRNVSGTRLSSTVTTNFGVNVNIFNFFEQRQQIKQ
jgi:hypothetical protein